MRIVILGRGHVGSALAHALGAAHQVTMLGREVEPAAVDGADLLILATPYPAAVAALQACGDLGDTVVIDATNPLQMTPEGLALTLGHETSGAETLTAAVPGVRLVKAFNQTGFENMAAARAFPTPTVMFVAGDDDGAKAVASQVVRDAGFEAVDAGPLRAARLLEPLAMLWIELALKRDQGRDFAFSLVRRPA